MDLFLNNGILGITACCDRDVKQVNRDRFEASICVGTCGVYRRAALAPFGGTAAIGYSEGVHTGFNCTQLGYKVSKHNHIYD